MVSFFQWAPQDQSIFYLSQLFGYMDNVLPVAEGNTTIISAMLKVINTTALVVGAILIVITTVRGLLKTAQEGEFLGKEWSSLWVPVRTLVGIASLFPTAAGYSLLQIALMWVIVQGIGAADTLWTTVLKYITATGSPYSTIVASNNVTPLAPATGTSSGGNSPATITVPTAMQNLYYGLTCQETLARNDPDTYTDNSISTVPLYYCNKYATGDPFCKMSFDERTKITTDTTTKLNYFTFSMGPGGVCGTMQFPNPATYPDPADSTGKTLLCQSTGYNEKLQCAGITQQVTTLQSIVSTLAMYAANTAEVDHEYFQFYFGVTPSTKTTQPFPTPAWIQAWCTASGIAANDCCMPVNAPAGGPPGSCSTSSSFPYPYAGSATSPSYTDEATNTTTNIIWPYGLEAPLGSSYDQIGTVTNKYLGDINGAISNVEIANQTLTGDLATAGSEGWLVAGTYYYEIAKESNGAITATMPPLSVQSSNPSMNTDFNAYRQNWQTANDIVTAVSKTTTATTNSATPPALSSATGALNSMASSITGNFMNEISGGDASHASKNPLVAAQAFGEDLLISAQATYVPMLIISTAAITIANIDVMFIGTGLTQNPAGPAIEFVTVVLWALYMAFAGWCFTFGGMLAIYMPLVPYIIFTAAVIGWMISVLEAMVAAPFVAIGIMSPTGHELLGRAEPAIMIILNTFLRPTLLILGMMAGMILAPLVVTMINTGFNIVIGSIYGGSHAPGPVELILMITAYGSLVCSAMNKCFAVIYVVPDRVLTWLGGHAPPSSGEAEAAQEVKRGVEGAAGGIAQGADSFGKTMHDQGKKLGEEKTEENKELNIREAASRKAALSGKSAGTGGSGKSGGSGSGGIHDGGAAPSSGGDDGGDSGGGGGALAGGGGEGATGGVSTDSGATDAGGMISPKGAAATSSDKKPSRFASKADLLKHGMMETRKEKLARQEKERAADKVKAEQAKADKAAKKAAKNPPKKTDEE